VKTVKLLKLTENGWIAVPTELLREEAGHFYFTARATGLSTFAIVGELLGLLNRPTVRMVIVAIIIVAAASISSIFVFKKFRMSQKRRAVRRKSKIRKR
jgi:hypothetical protein